MELLFDSAQQVSKVAWNVALRFLLHGTFKLGPCFIERVSYDLVALTYLNIFFSFFYQALNRWYKVWNLHQYTYSFTRGSYLAVLRARNFTILANISKPPKVMPLLLEAPQLVHNWLLISEMWWYTAQQWLKIEKSGISSWDRYKYVWAILLSHSNSECTQNKIEFHIF